MESKSNVGKDTKDTTRTSGSTTGSSGSSSISGSSGSSGSTGSTASMGSTGGSTGSSAANTSGGRSTTQAGSATQTARDNEQGGINQAKQMATEAYDRTSEVLSNTYDKTMTYGRENPGTLTLIAFGAGIGIGLLLAGSMGGRSRTSRIAEPLIGALSQVALEYLR